jgi:hypothetical protein
MWEDADLDLNWGLYLASKLTLHLHSVYKFRMPGAFHTLSTYVPTRRYLDISLYPIYVDWC